MKLKSLSPIAVLIVIIFSFAGLFYILGDIVLSIPAKILDPMLIDLSDSRFDKRSLDAYADPSFKKWLTTKKGKQLLKELKSLGKFKETNRLLNLDRKNDNLRVSAIATFESGQRKVDLYMIKDGEKWKLDSIAAYKLNPKMENQIKQRVNEIMKVMLKQDFKYQELKSYLNPEAQKIPPLALNRFLKFFSKLSKYSMGNKAKIITINSILNYRGQYFASVIIKGEFASMTMSLEKINNKWYLKSFKLGKTTQAH